MLAAVREGRTVFVQDESTFSLKPYTTRAWYPRGPAVNVPLTHAPYDRIYVYGVMNGKQENYFFYDGRNKRPMNSAMTLDFLQHLHARYPRVLLFWDKASHHRSAVVRNYAGQNDIRLIEFPTAVPEENPAEQAWKTIAAATANTYYASWEELLISISRSTKEKNFTKMFQYLSH